MTIRQYLFFILVFTTLLADGQHNDQAMEPLKQQLIQRLSLQQGCFAVAFTEPATGRTLLINEKEVFHAASTMKTPVMIEVYKQAAEGLFSLTDSLTLHTQFTSIADSSTYRLSPAEDSDSTLYVHAGSRVSIAELLYKMIVVSSNLATNLLLEKVGAEKVTATMHTLGARNIQVLRGVEDNKAYAKGLNNTTTAYDLLRIFEQMALGKTVSRAASDSMIHILLNQQFNEIIPAQLPPDVKVAHKTGFIQSIHHDSGIVFLPDGRMYVLVLLSKNWTNEAATLHTLSGVSGDIYRYLMNQAE